MAPLFDMSHASDEWKDYGSWTEFCKENPQFSSLHFSKVCDVASKHSNGKSCRVTPGKFACGGLNVLCEVTFEDGVIWLCRAGWMGDEYSDKYVKSMLESTVTTMRYLRVNSTLPIPDVYAYEFDRAKSDLGAAYLFIEPIPGIADDEPVSPIDDIKVQRHVAYVMTELSRHTFPTIGWLRETAAGILPGPMVDEAGNEYGPFETSLHFFKHQAKRLRREHATSRWAVESPKQSRFACWLYDQLTLCLDTCNSGPFPLMHPEVCKSQLILTRNFELNGVIDWDGVGTVPWLLFCCYPSTLKVPWPRVDSGRFSLEVVAEILATRKLYVDALREFSAAREESASRIINILENDGEKVEVVDLMVCFGGPYYRYDGKRIYNYIFPDSMASIEEFRDDESRWQGSQVVV